MVRFAGSLRAAAATVVVLGLAATTSAQEARSSNLSQPALPQSTAPPHDPDAAALGRIDERRPAALIPLYASVVALQALDLHSTSYALAAGGVETNPALKGVSGTALGIAALKAAGTAGLIFECEKIRKKNRTAAIVLMIATNSAMAWVVEHNYRIGR